MAAPETVLVVEDDADLQQLLADELSDAGHTVLTAGSVQQAIEHLQTSPIALVVSDLRLPGANGLALLQHIREADSGAPTAPPAFIMVTAFGTVEQAVDALKQGADDFLTKPIKLDHLRISVERALQRRRMQDELARYKAVVQAPEFHGMLGRSPVMQTLFNHIRVIARAEGPVLISGESGTGKELVARAIHAESSRSNKPFVAINCAGIPAELLESELFGHTASAFTGAGKARQGLFAEANGGTLLLDEIGEMPVDMQAKLLRILQDGRIRPVGANQEQQLDVRIVAATNRDLHQAVQKSEFREDLYFRLQTFNLYTPSLTERGDDIELLIAHFIRQVALQQNRSIRQVSEPVLQRLRTHRFPGNVRELASVIERAVTFCTGDTLTLDDLPAALRNAALSLPATPTDDAQSTGVAALPPELQPLLTALAQSSTEADDWLSLAELEQHYIAGTLKHFNNNKRKAAAALGIGRRTLYRKLGEETDDEG